MVVDNALPDASDIVAASKHISLLPMSIVSTVKIPEPAGIVAPVNENPRAVPPLADTINPADDALPPAPPVSVAPLTEN